LAAIHGVQGCQDKSMTKQEITRSVSAHLDISEKQAKLVVQRVLGSILETLAGDGRIELRRFGVFEVQPRAARRARNPRTGERVHVPATHRVSFKPGRIMQEQIQGGPRRSSQAAEPPTYEPAD
jgi:nucleoid DNA-binding protein